MTAAGARHALLYDTEAALRLVDGEVRALTGAADTPSPPALERASAEVQALLASVRNSRTVIEGLDTHDHACVAPAEAARALTDIEARLRLLADLLDPSPVRA